MVIYKKTFPLGKSISFSHYIKALEKKHFSKYYLLIEKIPSTTNYRAIIVFTGSMGRWGWRTSFMQGEVFLKECTFQYSEGEKHFTIQASARTENLVLASSMVIFAIFLFVSVLFMMASNDNMSLSNISIITITTIVMLIPSTLIYLQDKSFLDKVGSLGTELERNQ